MKKLMVVLGVLLVAGGLCLADTFTNSLGRVFNIVEVDGGVYLTPVALSTTSAAQSQTSAFTVRVDTNAAPTVTNYTPFHYGDVLVGTVSGKVWMATGLTTSDWKLLN